MDVIVITNNHYLFVGIQSLIKHHYEKEKDISITCIGFNKFIHTLKKFDTAKSIVLADKDAFRFLSVISEREKIKLRPLTNNKDDYLFMLKNHN
ncbi:hypothetical protein ED28_07865 [[Pantoea] beijingensis]|uniref:Uncharacterized protein n=1 Tax=[Pantoea] beijingensis TaxID=1324864 RepID=A0A443IE63_9GAMM|nr:hypothetical protein ED28_07865 [[Pantoea] beijingensis]